MVHKAKYQVDVQGLVQMFEVDATSEADAKRQVNKMTKGELKRVEASGGDVFVDRL